MVVKNKANINIKIDLEDKAAADAIFAHMGLTTSAAVNMLLNVSLMIKLCHLHQG